MAARISRSLSISCTCNYTHTTTDTTWLDETHYLTFNHNTWRTVNQRLKYMYVMSHDVSVTSNTDVGSDGVLGLLADLAVVHVPAVNACIRLVQIRFHQYTFLRCNVNANPFPRRHN